MLKEIKTNLRKEIKTKLKNLSHVEKKRQSEIVCNKLMAWPSFQAAKTVMLFWSMPDEVDTHELVTTISKTKHVLLPVIDNDIMVVKSFQGFETMSSDNPFRIGEPTGEIVSNPQPDFIVMPGLAFDSNCNRLGRGKGYYDKFLAKSKYTVPRIAIAFNEQLVDSIPTEPHDIPIDGVITPDYIFLND